MNPMQQKELASQLRQGNCWQYANDRAARSRDTVFRDKQTATDWELVKVASTCLFCRRSAADDEINQAMSHAHNAESFLELIQSDIEHALDCDYEDALHHESRGEEDFRGTD